MRTRVPRRPIVFLRIRFSICERCSILILLIKTLRCSIRSLQHRSLQHTSLYYVSLMFSYFRNNITFLLESPQTSLICPSVKCSFDIYRIHNVSVYNTTIYFIYIKQYVDRATYFDLHWFILRPSKKTDPRLYICFTETQCGIPNAHRMLQRYSINFKLHVFVNIGATAVTLNNKIMY